MVFERDPAARSVLEVLLCYPGFHALLLHRLGHWLWKRRFHLLARFFSHMGRLLTGIEIHPGAQIGPQCFIDHGMGVVIGETAEVGEGTTIYQGVTLGGTTWKKVKRHPTVGCRVIIGAGAKLLGAITVGDGSIIGSGSVVVKDVPPHSTVVGVPGRIVFKDGQKITGMEGVDQSNLPDPVAQVVKCILDRICELERELHRLQRNYQQTEKQVEQITKQVEPEEPCSVENIPVIQHFIDGGGI